MIEQLGFQRGRSSGDMAGLQRSSLPDFIRRAQDFQVGIETAESLVLGSYDEFSPGHSVWPRQCDAAVSRVMALVECLQPFQALLETPAHLPMGVVPLRFPLLIAMKTVKTRTDQLLQRLAALRDASRTAPGQTWQQQAEVQKLLEALQLGNRTILDELRLLLDKARFQEHIYRAKAS